MFTKYKLMRVFSLIFNVTLILVNLKSSHAIAEKRTVIITGANRGVGFEAAKKLASTNQWTVVMACRSEERAFAAASSIPLEVGFDNIEIEVLDLADFQSIQAFKNKWGKRPLHCLALNAGLSKSGNIVGKTAQGFEETVGVNHIGHFFLMQLLIPNLKSVEGGRIVFVGSGVHNPAEAGGNVGSKATLGDMSGLRNGFKDPISMIDGGDYDADKAYKDSKLCNVMTSLEMGRRLASQVKLGKGVTCNCMNPGLIPTTGLFRDFNPFFVFIFTFITRYIFKVAATEEDGGRKLAYMISSPELRGINGKYYSALPNNRGGFIPTSTSIESRDIEKCSQLFTLTENIIKSELK